MKAESPWPAEVVPGEAHAPAGAAGVPEDARGDGLAEGLQHALQLLLLHGERQVGQVQVGGVLLLLLEPQRSGGSTSEETQRYGNQLHEVNIIIIITHY